MTHIIQITESGNCETKCLNRAIHLSVKFPKIVYSGATWNQEDRTEIKISPI